MILEYLSNATDLTPVEEIIRDFILKYPSKVEKMTISELANATHVGMASINRFCKKLGYNGFAAFKLNFVKDTKKKEKIETVRKIEPFSHDSTYEDVINRIPYLYDKAIGYTKSQLNPHVMNRVTKSLYESLVIIIGTGLNKALADIFTYKMEELGFNCRSFDSLHVQYIDMMIAKKQKIYVILLSHSGTNPAIIYAAKFLHRRKIKTALICSVLTPELQPYVSDVLKIIPTKNTKELSSTHFMSSTQYVLDVFIVLLLIKNYKEVAEVGIKSNYYK